MLTPLKPLPTSCPLWDFNLSSPYQSSHYHFISSLLILRKAPADYGRTDTTGGNRLCAHFCFSRLHSKYHRIPFPSTNSTSHSSQLEILLLLCRQGYFCCKHQHPSHIPGTVPCFLAVVSVGFHASEDLRIVTGLKQSLPGGHITTGSAASPPITWCLLHLAVQTSCCTQKHPAHFHVTEREKHGGYLQTRPKMYPRTGRTLTRCFVCTDRNLSL